MTTTTTTSTLTVTAETTVQALIDAGLTLAQLQCLVNAKQSGASTTTDRAAFAHEVYAMMLEQPTAQWKNGTLLKVWFPNGKEADAEMEKQRVKKHQMISRALADLASDGYITKERSGNSASTTFYKVVESKMPKADAQDDAQDESSESQALAFEDKMAAARWPFFVPSSRTDEATDNATGYVSDGVFLCSQAIATDTLTILSTKDNYTIASDSRR